MLVLRQCLFIALVLCARIAAAQTPPVSLDTLASAVQAHPDSLDARHALELAVGNGLPDSLSPALAAELPVDITPIADSLGTLIVPKPFLTTTVTEPQQEQIFSKVTYLYSTDGGIFCRVHYTTPDDAPLAARMARLLALAHQVLVSKLGSTPRDTAPFDVWLCRQGKAGGEQWGRNLYFYDLDASRSSIEWIREIVHEYSHLALPPIGGYKDPEYWANGYIGERLIVRWIQRAPDGPALVTQIWGDFSGAHNFDHLLIDPALALYHRIGPNSQWLARTDADGMRYLIGQTLTVDDKYGSRAVADAFALLPRQATPADLAEAFSSVVAHRATVRKP